MCFFHQAKVNTKTVDGGLFHRNTQFIREIQQVLLNNSVLKLLHVNRRRTGILDVGEPTLNVGEQTVGETTSGRNDRLPGKHVHGSTTTI